MAWAKLGTVTSTVTVSDLTTGVFTANKFIMAISYHDDTPAANTSGAIRVGVGTIDTTANYAYRRSDNGGTDSTTINASYIYTGQDGGNQLMITYGVNIDGEEKLFIQIYVIKVQ